MAGLPVAYSAGFSPHPKISYSGGVSTGAASEAEYLEISLTGLRDPDDVRTRLSAALPDGIDVIEVMDLAQVAEAPRLEASHWQIVLPGVAPAEDATMLAPQQTLDGFGLLTDPPPAATALRSDAFTRTPAGPNSAAQDLVSRTRAALLEP